MAECFIGLMSGTSVDSVDAVLVDFSTAQPRLLSRHNHPIPAELRRALLALTTPGEQELHRLALADNAVARLFAEAVHRLLAGAGVPAGAVRAIGSHGQTVRHAPAAEDPYTVQIGNPSLLAELTNIAVVADFRRRDVAAGGQGAPLAPVFHAAFFRDPVENRAVVNIGGIANLTLLPAGAEATITGFDTGPGNALLDAWAERHLGTPLDRDGAWAASGQTRPELLEQLLADPYFRQPPPKSTGREHFNLDWLDDRLTAREREEPADVQATLTVLSARTIAADLTRYAPATRRLLICGGGVHNPVLSAALREQLGQITVQSSADLGVDPDTLEALGFAWLARRTLNGQTGNLPTVTGARGPRVLGGIYPV